MDGADFGALGFWIFIAAIFVAMMWSSSRSEAEKHETLRRMMEKTGSIDEAKLKELFTSAEVPRPKPGGGYRKLRIFGTIIMFIGAGLAIFFGTMMLLAESGLLPPPMTRGEPLAALSVAAGIAVVGLGVFFSSRFAEPPPDSRNEPSAR